MGGRLRLGIGQYSGRGRKPENQDFHGACAPQEPLLTTKGIVVALADGIGSSAVSHIASQTAVAGFLDDYYCTPESWSVRTASEKVLAATNSWLHAQSRHNGLHGDLDRGYVCTLCAVVFKSHTAHLFHVGDSRIYRIAASDNTVLEQLTDDHRLQVAPGQSYLSRALGMQARLEIDYRALQVEPGDVFVLTTDGVHDHVQPKDVVAVVAGGNGDLDAAARALAELALERGSTDNLSVQLVRVDSLPAASAAELLQQLAALPFPPEPAARLELDGYRLQRELHASSRSHVWLARDLASGASVAIKMPSVDLRDDPQYLERFLLEEWIARRIDNPHVLKPLAPRRRSSLYLAMEYVDGRTLAQWMIDHPRPKLEAVRGIIEQIARGLRAFHRLEMLHQDLRPANIMIDGGGTVKIIDFGAVAVAGIEETLCDAAQPGLPGSAQFMAPEYFLGEPGSPRSDQFSLGVIAYQMLTGTLPYGMQMAQARSRAAQRKLAYRTALADDRELPAWVDEALHRAVHPDPQKRYQELSEFVHELHHPNAGFQRRRRPSLVDRNPLLFWKALSFMLLIVVLVLLAQQTGGR